MSTDPTPRWASPQLPRAPWILVERTTLDQTATSLERLEAWLLGGELDAATDCAHTLSRGQDDPTGLARWVGTLARQLRTRIEEASSWS